MTPSESYHSAASWAEDLAVGHEAVEQAAIPCREVYLIGLHKIKLELIGLPRKLIRDMQVKRLANANTKAKALPALVCSAIVWNARLKTVYPVPVTVLQCQPLHRATEATKPNVDQDNP
ncbi:hypothetical protein NUW58_g1052 [Xylaria curta]|uniref:Uncharacterized protein n=1 Tax=Xylaria curta TaxID=42375 RepID=A0ACC1PLX0_9PEZI|nr:hypothetical protein NUW58_g1052 [Xylaria curta]